MQYLGGKSRIATKIAPLILSAAHGRRNYLEPFIGGGSVFERVAPHFPVAIGADIAPDLAMMWNEAINGWIPPTTISQEEYEALRTAKPSALRGFVGFGCSFGGKWFAGFARSHSGDSPRHNYARSASRSVTRAAGKLKHARVVCADYRDHVIDSGLVIYCDPPYANTTPYAFSRGFDSAEFWRVADQWHQDGAAVIVSERSAPDEWVEVWSRELPDYLGGRQIPDSRRESLFARGDTAKAILDKGGEPSAPY